MYTTLQHLLQISLIRIKKSPFSRLKKRQSEVNTSSTSHREFQRRKNKTEKKRPRNKKTKFSTEFVAGPYGR
jgi:hypothetical protein